MSTADYRVAFRNFDLAIQINELILFLISNKLIIDNWLDDYSYYTDQVELANFSANLKKLKRDEFLESGKQELQTIRIMLDDYVNDVFSKPLLVIHKTLSKSDQNLTNNSLIRNCDFNPFSLEVIINSLTKITNGYSIQSDSLDIFLISNLLSEHDVQDSHMFKLYSIALRASNLKIAEHQHHIFNYSKSLNHIKSKLADDYRIYDYQEYKQNENLPNIVQKIYYGFNTAKK